MRQELWVGQLYSSTVNCTSPAPALFLVLQIDGNHVVATLRDGKFFKIMHWSKAGLEKAIHSNIWKLQE